MRTAAAPAILAPPARRISLERLRGALLWLTGLASAFVFIEPSPYEVMALATILVFAVTGLGLSAPLMPFAVLLIFVNLGFSVAALPVLGEPRVLTWVLVSWYLAGTAVFFAAALGENTARRLDLLVAGYMAAALIASLAAIAGYFRLLPGAADLLTRYGRAQGTFNDPNVLGAFLIPPALFALQRILRGGAAAALAGAALLGIFSVALLLSFSRAAWGQLAFCAALQTVLSFATGATTRERLRSVAVAIIAAVAVAGAVTAVVSIDAVSELFRERASLAQSYDAGPMGRFGRYVAGAVMVLERPGGIGPLQFFRHFPEDPHNSYLNAFVSGGWVSGLAYAALVLLTLASGLRYLAVPTPWQGSYVVIFVAYVGVAAESLLIDTDHWRHYFLLLGVLWGLIAATVRWRHGQRLADGRRPGPRQGLASAARPA